MRLIGIDPGLTGALAIVEEGPEAPILLEAVDLPITTVGGGKSAKRIDGKKLYEYLDAACHFYGISSVVLERQVYRPTFVNGKGGKKHKLQAGGVSIFSIGLSYGIITGVLGALSVTTLVDTANVMPSTWKRSIGLSANKREVVETARSLFTSTEVVDDNIRLVKHHNRAEAALLGIYGLRHADQLGL